MSRNPEQRETGDIARSFFLQAVGLFMAMLFPYAILDGFQATVGSLLILAVYAFAVSYLKNRGRPRRRAGKRGDNKTFLLVLMYMGGGFLAVSGFFGLIVVLWLGLAYTGTAGDPLPLGAAMLGGLGHTLTLLAGGIVLLALSIVLMHWGRGGAGVLARRIRRHGPGLFLAPWLSETLMLMLMLGGSSLMVLPIPLEIIIDNMYLGRRTLFPDGIWLFPFLPLGMFATAVLVIALTEIMEIESFGAICRALREDAAAPTPRDGWWSVLVTIILGASAGVTVSVLWALHVALVAATASVPAMLTGISTAGALDDWSAGQLAAGRPTAEIVAMVNEHGRWSTAEPDKGLPELLPGLGEDLAEMDLRRDCRITVASAPADPEEIGTIEWPNMSDWTPAIERYSDESNRVGKAAEAENEVVPEADEPYEPPALRYCIRVACASPVAWNAPPSVFLYSSHPGSSPEWMWWMRIDLFAAGRAPESGGYCTETGALAERYQG